MEPLSPQNPIDSTEAPVLLATAISEPTTPPPTLAHRIFFGPYGLRAGWGLLLFIAMIASTAVSVQLIQKHQKASQQHAAAVASQSSGKPADTAKPDKSTPVAVKEVILSELVIFAVIFLFTWIMSLIERRELSAYGLGGTHSIARFFVGALWGILAISALIFTLHATHHLTFDTQLLHGPAILGWGFIVLAAFFLVGIFEEYLFRGYLQFTFYRGMVGLGNLISPTHARSIAFWIAAIFTSAIFLIAHTTNGGETRLGLFQVFLAGLVFVVALWRTGSLWWGIGFHMAWDWGQSFLYGVPDSGGYFQGRLFATHASGNPLLSGSTVGPEGSVLCIPILILVILILFTLKPSPQPSLEQKPERNAALPETYALVPPGPEPNAS
jgi:membrane protease YdiL (CAAX protease family)